MKDRSFLYDLSAYLIYVKVGEKTVSHMGNEQVFLSILSVRP